MRKEIMICDFCEKEVELMPVTFINNTEAELCEPCQKIFYKAHEEAYARLTAEWEQAQKDVWWVYRMLESMDSNRLKEVFGVVGLEIFDRIGDTTEDAGGGRDA